MIWTQSKLKDFEQNTTCPHRWHAQWVLGTIPFPSNINMDRGKYFEYHAIGGGATDEEVTALPSKRNGDPYIATVRIDEQIELFKRHFGDVEDISHDDHLGYELYDVQKVLEWEDYKGTVDFFCKDVSTGKKYLADLKLTGNLTHGYWSNLNYVDFTQQIHYKNLYRKQYGEDIDLVLFIYDYSPAQEFVELHLDIGEDKIKAVETRFDEAKYMYKKYDEASWDSYNPSESECERCPLKCNKRFKPE